VEATIDSVGRATRRVRRTLDDAGASLAGRRVLALCSGGADSVALVALLDALPRGAAPRSIHVLHVDHGLRADCANERSAAQRAAAAVGAPFHTADVQLELGAGDSVEAQARTARYDAAIGEARRQGCDVICTGHSANDQAEQALLALIGVTGRGGDVDAMPVRRELDGTLDLVRPLLGLSRSDLEASCHAVGLAWADDPTNADADAFARNAVRHRVVAPLLDVHPGAAASLARAGARTRATTDAAVSLADALLDAWAVTTTLDLRQLAPLPAVARSELLARWLARAELGRGHTTRLVRAVDHLAMLPARAACARVDLPGAACVRRDGYDLTIHRTPRHGGSQP
jgi:tRNA(Ile)-lysidine synthase